MSKYVTFELEIHATEALSRVLEVMSDAEIDALVNDLIADGYGTAPAQQETLNLDDPAVRLQAIVELRRLGYSVEPTTGGAR